MTDAIGRGVGRAVVNGVTQGVEGAVARREAGAAVEAGANLARRELGAATGDAVDAGTSALRRGAPNVPTAAPLGSPAAAFRAPAAAAVPLTAEHQAAKTALTDLQRAQSQFRPGSVEARSFTPRIEAAQVQVAVHETLASAQLQRTAVNNLAPTATQSQQRAAYQKLAMAERAHSEALLTAGRPMTEVAQVLRNEGRAFEAAARRDLNEGGTGRAWVTDLNSSLQAYGRAGDTAGALRVLGQEGKISAAAGIVRGSSSFQGEQAANGLRVGRGLVDAQRAAGFVQDGVRIPPRPPLTDAQWSQVRPMLQGNADPLAILRDLNGMP